MTLAALRLLPEGPTSVAIRLPLTVVLAVVAGVLLWLGEGLWIGARPWFDRER